jgi:hypothetical protein
MQVQAISTIPTTELNPSNTLYNAVQEQMQQELSTGMNDKPVKESTKFMVLQKFGFVAPQLTNGENMEIREESRHAKRAA